jgi:uracil-DNA glycosylase
MPAPARPALDVLLEDIHACRHCAAQLPLGPRPILRASASARLLVVGQAPGTRAHASGIPWDDASGARLREWLGLPPERFYDTRRVAIVPMGFCYPGRGAGGDAAPRPECRATWHPRLLPLLTGIELTLLIGQHAQTYFLGKWRKPTLAATVAAWAEYAPRQLPLPHPSPRNLRWLREHAWFERDVVPMLRARVAALWPTEPPSAAGEVVVARTRR